MAEQKPALDMVKGMLILMVIVGHLGELTAQRHILLWLGSGLRMPLMIGISGYLLNLARIRSSPRDDLLRRYGRRLILPWAVATMIYLLVAGHPVGWITPIAAILRAPFHLWYIPALCLLTLAARVIPLPSRYLLAIGTPVSLMVMSTFGLGHGSIGSGPLAPDSRLLLFPIYFFLGMVVAEQEATSRLGRLALFLAPIGMIWWCLYFFVSDHMGELISRLIMNVGLIGLIPRVAALPLSFTLINLMGRESLFFYLWHPLALSVALESGLPAWAVLPWAATLLFLLCLMVRQTGVLCLILGTIGRSKRQRIVVLPQSQPA